MLNKKLQFQTHTPYLVWRIFSIAVVGLMTTGMVASLIFMYKNIHDTIQNSTVIVSLSDPTSLHAIDLALFQKTEARLQDKQAVRIWPDPLRNIFLYDTSSSSTRPTTAASTTATSAP